MVVHVLYTRLYFIWVTLKTFQRGFQKRASWQSCAIVVIVTKLVFG